MDLSKERGINGYLQMFPCQRIPNNKYRGVASSVSAQGAGRGGEHMTTTVDLERGAGCG